MHWMRLPHPLRPRPPSGPDRRRREGLRPLAARCAPPRARGAEGRTTPSCWKAGGSSPCARS
ncbi:hypothetical protein ACFPRL_07000 [Pseudoclavibacter helvolus]